MAHIQITYLCNVHCMQLHISFHDMASSLRSQNYLLGLEKKFRDSLSMICNIFGVHKVRTFELFKFQKVIILV